MIRPALLALFAAAAFGQSFEVASIKIHEGPTPRIGVTTSGLRLTADASNIHVLLMYAYNLKRYQIVGTAPLLDDYNLWWDVVAKAEGDTPPGKDAFRHMMQALLADRFQLKAHTEMREMPVYAIVVGKGGIKFKKSAPDADEWSQHSRKGRDNVITLPKATMSDVVDAVSNAMLDRPVVDHTGLTGTYSIKLTYTPNTRANRESEPDLNDISVFQALEEQLGLRLEARKESVEVLAIDHVEKPINP